MVDWVGLVTHVVYCTVALFFTGPDTHLYGEDTSICRSFDSVNHLYFQRVVSDPFDFRATVKLGWGARIQT